MLVTCRFVAAVAIAVPLAMIRAAAQDSPAAPGAAGGTGGATLTVQQPRPAADPALVARGKTLYGVNCMGCHGADLRGGDAGGPNLLRSPVVLSDQHGELILPIVRGARADKGMPPVNLPDTDVAAVAEYIHSVAALSPRPGSPAPVPPLVPNPIAGDAAAGQAYFAAKCGACHSPTGDLKSIASRAADPRALQDLWIAGGAGATAKEPREPHKPLLPVYTDKDIRDVTAYLLTLK